LVENVIVKPPPFGGNSFSNWLASSLNAFTQNTNCSPANQEVYRMTVPRTALDKPYQNFDLQIEQASNGYRVRVLDSPAGQANHLITLPFDLKTELDKAHLLGGRIHHFQSGAGANDRTVTPLDPKIFGARLFQAIFVGDVGISLRRSVDLARQQNTNLRIRLHLDETPELASLPWEYLYDGTHSRFLVLSEATSIVRYLALPLTATPLKVSTPLRLLVVIADASDVVPRLQVIEERLKLEAALRNLIDHGEVEITCLERATMSALQRALRKTEYHLFHFIGHGWFDAASQRHGLILENDQGRGEMVDTDRLAVLLHNHPSLRLAFLNACEGARFAEGQPLAGVAQHLVQQGLPAVIAMQFPVRDRSAITLAQEFYDALANRYPVDAALTEARIAIFGQNSGMDWGTPVLFMRSSDGNLWQAKEETVRKEEQERRQMYTESSTYVGRNTSTENSNLNISNSESNRSEYNSSTYSIIKYDHNPLEPCMPFIHQLVTRLKDVSDTDNNKDSLLEKQILDCIANLYSARSVFTVTLYDNLVSVLASYSSSNEAHIQEAIRFIQTVVSSAEGKVSRQNITTLITSGSERFCLVSLIPPKDDKSASEFLVIAGIPDDSSYLGDEFSLILNAAYFATNKFSSISFIKLEEDIYDNLRRRYLSLPNSLISARKKIFESRLLQLTFHFQPIIRLHKSDIYISSWEALARDNLSKMDSAPQDLLASVELWGGELTAFFDQYVLELAIQTYRKKLRNIKGMRRAEDIKELAINVYPQSLENRNYYNALKDIIGNGIIPCEKLILELSERKTFPSHAYFHQDQTSAARIRDSVKEYVRDFQINFSIDDFGTGDNQLDKLSLLPVSYIKVDRNILYENHASAMLDFIVKTANNSGLVIPKVIVEGFEDGQKLTLADLYKLGIKYVQCFWSGMPKDSPYRLEREMIHKIRNDILIV